MRPITFALLAIAASILAHPFMDRSMAAERWAARALWLGVCLAFAVSALIVLP